MLGFRVSFFMFLKRFLIYHLLSLLCFNFRRRLERERISTYPRSNIWGHSPSHDDLEREFAEYFF